MSCKYCHCFLSYRPCWGLASVQRSFSNDYMYVYVYVYINRDYIILVHSTSSCPATDEVIRPLHVWVPCVRNHLADKWKTSHCNLKRIVEVAHGDLFDDGHLSLLTRWFGEDGWTITCTYRYHGWEKMTIFTYSLKSNSALLLTSLCITISRLLPEVEKLLPLFLPNCNGFWNASPHCLPLMKVLDGGVDTPKQPIHRSDLRLDRQIDQRLFG